MLYLPRVLRRYVIIRFAEQLLTYVRTVSFNVPYSAGQFSSCLNNTGRSERFRFVHARSFRQRDAQSSWRSPDGRGSVFTSCSSSRFSRDKGSDRFERKKFPWRFERGRASRTVKGQFATSARLPGAALRPRFLRLQRDQFRARIPRLKRRVAVYKCNLR